MVLNTDSPDWSKFETVDPFNENFVAGKISHHHGDEYGALFIEKVNGIKCPQIISATPKLAYPFDRNGNWHFPKAKQILRYEKIDGCLSPYTPIKLNSGEKVFIKDLYGETDIKVWTHDVITGNTFVSQVTKVHRFELFTPLVKVIFNRLKGQQGMNRWYPDGGKPIICTQDHKFWTPKGWIEAQNLFPGQIIYVFWPQIEQQMREFLIGAILGDSCIGRGDKTNPSIGFGHSEHQKEYLELKYNLLKNYAKTEVNLRPGGGGYTGSPQWRFETICDPAFRELAELFYPNVEEKKHVPVNIVQDLSPLVLAIWYLDDGSLQRGDGFKTRQIATFATNGFEREDCEKLVAALEQKYSFMGKVYDYGSGPAIGLNADSSERFFSIIAPYIPKCMQYKLPAGYGVTISYLDQRGPFKKLTIAGMKETTVQAVESIETNSIKSPKKYVYDLSVQDTPAYFANDVLVHNTNIFAYQYHDAGNNKFVSYKTRLLPFVQESKFGPFLSMWKEMLVKYPEIPKFVFRHFNMSFELWGARNAHLVKYETPLQASLLFTRDRANGKVSPPLASIDVLNDLYNFPQAKFAGSVGKDYIYNYQEAQKELEGQLKEVEDGYLGQEGEVWYLLDELGNWNLFKCKPSTIEAIHWSAGGIGKNVIFATIENSFESWEIPTIENIKTLLLEEFLASEIEKVHYSIERQLQRALENHIFVVEVLEHYKALGLSVLTQKRETMRAMSEHYQRNQMSKVFSTIYNSEVK